MSKFKVTVSVQNLEAGLNWWRGPQQKGNWPSDLHASLYKKQAKRQRVRLNEEWWKEIVGDLADWRAIRPLTKSEILKNGRARLPELARAYEGLRLRNLSFEKAGWSDLALLFEIARSIKPTKSNSPVFASKLCHFLAPKLFVVIDQEATGVTPYDIYWTTCAEAWREARGIYKTLQKILANQIQGADGPTFPMATKITELCVIGAHANRAST